MEIQKKAFFKRNVTNVIEKEESDNVKHIFKKLMNLNLIEM